MKGKFPSERIAGCKLQPCGIGVYGQSPDFERFGAYSHKYKLSLPVSEETIQKFEEQEGIRLPEEYSAFLMYVGNGGAGPYHGLYGVETDQKELHDSHGTRLYRVREESVIYLNMSDEDWDRVADPEGRQKGKEVCPYVGVLPIGSQGYTLMTGIMLAGPYWGQVVCYDEDFCGQPFLCGKKDFLTGMNGGLGK